jgi:hypothetical protein
MPPSARGSPPVARCVTSSRNVSFAFAQAQRVDDRVFEVLRGERRVVTADDGEDAVAEHVLRGLQRGLRLVAVGRHAGDAHQVRLEVVEHPHQLDVVLQAQIEDLHFVLGDHRGEGRERHRLTEPDRVLEPDPAGSKGAGCTKRIFMTWKGRHDPRP